MRPNRRWILVLLLGTMFLGLSWVSPTAQAASAAATATPTRAATTPPIPVSVCGDNAPLSVAYLPGSAFINDMFPLTDGSTLLRGVLDNTEGIWLARMDTAGNLLWQNLYGASGASLSLTPNEHILLEFSRTQVEIDLDGKVVRAVNAPWYWPNADGSFTVGDGNKLARYKDPQTPLWQVEIKDYAGYFTTTTDGGGLYAYTGTYVDTSVYTAPVYTDIKVIKVSPDGQATQRVYGRLVGDENLERMFRTPDGGALLVGTHYYDMLGGDADIWLMKINAGGSMSWQTTLKLAPNGEYLSDILLLKSGYLVMVETMDSLDPVWVYLKPNGGLYWQKVITSSRGPVRVNAAAPTADGGLLLAGQTWEKTSLYWLAKLDSKGNLLWEKTLGYDLQGAADSEVMAMVGLSNKQILLGGLTNQLGARQDTNFSAWIAQIPDSGQKLGLLSLVSGKFTAISSLGARPNTLKRDEILSSTAGPLKETTFAVKTTNLQPQAVCLPPNGVYPTPANLPTLTPSATPTPTVAPVPTLTRALYLASPAMQGEDVLRLQERLYELGYTEVGARDGIFGRMTEQAVIHFQERNALDVDGYVGPVTWRRLFSPTANPAKN